MSADSELESFAKWMLIAISEYHGCTTGDCPHNNTAECAAALVQQFREDTKSIGFAIPESATARHGRD